MSTIVHYECRNLDHLRAGSRRGKGGLVIHHGTVGYCDGLHVDGAHRWAATGGVPIEFLVETAPAMDPGTYRTDNGSLLHIRPSANGNVLFEVDGARSVARGDLRIGVKLSDDPDWPDGSSPHMALLHAD
jgi:streptogramin lyase